MSQFTVGIIVKLKSGGPEMTVVRELKTISSGGINMVRCQWFAGKKLESGDFPPDSLELVKPVPKAP
jgi:uncharacterized protein YodC (DUF2158 family)